MPSHRRITLPRENRRTLLPPTPVALPENQWDSFHVAGLQYHDRSRVAHRIRINDPLILATEPGNPFDSRALRIYCHGRMLGYVPRLHNRDLNRLLCCGVRIECRVSAVQYRADQLMQVRVQVTLGGRTSTGH